MTTFCDRFWTAESHVALVLLRFAFLFVCSARSSHGLAWKERMGIDLIAGASQLVRLLHEHDGYSNATQADRFRMLRGDRFRGVGCARDNWWELAYSEQEEACDGEAGREVYNPCPELLKN